MHIIAGNTNYLTKECDKLGILCILRRQQERLPNREEFGCWPSQRCFSQRSLAAFQK